MLPAARTRILPADDHSRLLAKAQRLPRRADSGFQARAQEVAAPERQYYARSLGQMRVQNWRAAGNLGQPVRPIGRRR